MTKFAFVQVDVFTAAPLKGNPLAVVLGADALTDAQMAAFANWTNLSETAFLLRPSLPEADYRVRIFTPQSELPFAGHPTLGACHAWLGAGGEPKGEIIVQECGIGAVQIRRDAGRLAFAAPPLRRAGPAEPEIREQIVHSLRIAPEAVRDAVWVDNGGGWVAVLLGSRAEVLALSPDFAAMAGLDIGVVAPWDNGEADFEVRGFAPGMGIPEDPVTGSLNAGLAQWFAQAGLAPAAYVVSQGTAMGRAGRVHIQRDGAQIWVGGNVVTCIAGELTL